MTVTLRRSWPSLLALVVCVVTAGATDGVHQRSECEELMPLVHAVTPLRAPFGRVYGGVRATNVATPTPVHAQVVQQVCADIAVRSVGADDARLPDDRVRAVRTLQSAALHTTQGAARRGGTWLMIQCDILQTVGGAPMLVQHEVGVVVYDVAERAREPDARGERLPSSTAATPIITLHTWRPKSAPGWESDSTRTHGNATMHARVGADGATAHPPASDSDRAEQHAQPRAAASRESAVHGLRIATYNLWNVNPPAWLAGHPLRRLCMYTLRMLAAGDVMRVAAPDILLLQEVRTDTSLHDATVHVVRDVPLIRALQPVHQWAAKIRELADTPAAAARLRAKVAAAEAAAASDVWNATGVWSHAAAQELAAAWLQPARVAAAVGAVGDVPHAQIAHVAAMLRGYHYAHMPAQSYSDGGEGEAVDEEGPAIFSRFPLRHTDYLLLSRPAHAARDDPHQRLLLHAVVESPMRDAAGEPVLLDVFSVHMSLSPSVRNVSVVEMLAFMAVAAQGSALVLAGDMNAEPHEPAMRALLQHDTHLLRALWREAASGRQACSAGEPVRRRLEGGGEVDSAVQAAFERLLHDEEAFIAAAPVLQDVWTTLHAEPQPGRNVDAATSRYAHTFPSDAPEKRIDYLLVGGRAAPQNGTPGASSRAAGGGVDVSVLASWLAGQDALPGTDQWEGQAGVGMLSRESPMYASDHRLLAADIALALHGD
ncbi:hypothetical protein EON68_00200 [archaeon]|nr:MAG: hypothetical protein EON68_00200 [archaeon]